MTNRLVLAALALALATTACSEPESGPLRVSAAGSEATLVNPNLEMLEPAQAFLLEAAAQGLVRFNATGEIEPALAQSWIVSDDGLRYTFRLRRTTWEDGDRVTAEQVVGRLRAAMSGASRNPLKPLLHMIDQIVPMTDEVLEISLVAPRPHFLQLLAQPEMAIARQGQGTGPFRLSDGPGGTRLLSPPPDADLDDGEPADPMIQLIAERMARGIARFRQGEADLVLGGTTGDLPLARAGQFPSNQLVFDPANGLFGLAFLRNDGVAGDPALRRALAMAVDRQALVQALDVPGLQPREAIVPTGIEELPEPSLPDWVLNPMAMRRALAGRAVADYRAAIEAQDGTQNSALPPIRVAMPDGPGYRLVFAHLRRDWRAIGIEAERVAAEDDSADLRFLDAVAPATLSTWYLRHFTCDRSPVCDAVADEMLAGARAAPNPTMRTIFLANADRILADAHPFIAIAAPVRWSLTGPRASAFRPNAFARHHPAELVEERP